MSLISLKSPFCNAYFCCKFQIYDMFMTCDINMYRKRREWRGQNEPCLWIVFSIHFVKKDLHIRTNIDILVPKTQVALSFALIPLSSMLSYCNFCIYTHPAFKMYSMTMIWYLHHSYIMFVHRRLNGQHSNRRTYLKL